MSSAYTDMAAGRGDAFSSGLASKKILPPTPDGDSPLERAVKILERNTVPRSSHNYGPVFLEYTLMSEYLILKKQQLSGVYVMPSAGSAFKWFGVLFIRQGLYQGGVFRLTLYIPDNYPDGDCPMLVFEPPVFHPLVNIETGELDVKRNFQKWRRNVNFLWQVLLCARRAFYKIETQSPLNPEAAVLYERDLELFKNKVAESIRLCDSRLYEKPTTEDIHAFHFFNWTQEVDEKVKTRLIPKNEDEEDPNHKTPGSVGLSWVKNGSLQIFSKTAS